LIFFKNFNPIRGFNRRFHWISFNSSQSAIKIYSIFIKSINISALKLIFYSKLIKNSIKIQVIRPFKSIFYSIQLIISHSICYNLYSIAIQIVPVERGAYPGPLAPRGTAAGLIKTGLEVWDQNSQSGSQVKRPSRFERN